MNLDKWDMLMIRQCKANTPNRNIMKRIFARRCGLPFDYVKDDSLIDYLSSICNELGVFEGMSGFVTACQRRMSDYSIQDALGYKTDKSFNNVVIETFVSGLRFLEGDRIPDYPSPLRFKNFMKKQAQSSSAAKDS